MKGPVEARKGALLSEQHQDLEDARAVLPASHRDADRVDELAS